MTSASSINRAELANAFRVLRCGQCNEQIESQAKFCGQCGTVMAAAQKKHGPYEEPKLGHAQSELPSFARAQFADLTPKVRAEINSIMSALLRERFLLTLNTIVLLCVNLFGFWLSLKAYTEFNGDEMTKLIIAFTPFLFVNCVGFVAMIPIRGTKREIYRLQQRLQFLRAQMEFNHVMGR